MFRHCMGVQFRPNRSQNPEAYELIWHLNDTVQPFVIKNCKNQDNDMTNVMSLELRCIIFATIVSWSKRL
jgi:hypothetical protein